MKRQNPSAIQRMFSRIASKYDLANHVLSMGTDVIWRRTMKKWAHIKPGESVLDVCTGTGDSLFVFRNTGAVLYGVDFSHEMLVVAHAKKERLTGNDSLYFIEADARSLPVLDESMDVCTIAFGLRNIVPFIDGIQEFQRVLKPDGRLLILEFTLPRWRPWRKVYLFYLRSILPILGKWITGDRSAYEYLRDTIPVFPHYDQLIEHVCQSGFEFVRWKVFMGGVATLYVFRKKSVRG